MSRFQAILVCGILSMTTAAGAEDLAPIALNSLSSPPANIASLKVMDQNGRILGQATRIQTDQAGRPAALAFRANNGSTVVISAAATSYDGHVLVTDNGLPQIAALSSVHTAANQ